MDNRVSPQPINGNNVLVLGGAGYLGSILVRKLIGLGCAVTVYDSFIYDPMSLEGLDTKGRLVVVRGDVRDTDRLSGLVAGKDAVINLAAIVGDAACDLDKNAAKAINAESNKTVYRLAHEHGVGRYVCASTCSVYGFGDELLREDSFLNPVSLYAQTKLTSELLLFMLSRRLDPALTILRFATLFGWSHRPRFDLVVNTMTSRAITEGKVVVFGGNQWRPHLHVSDAADVIVSVLTAPRRVIDGEIFNVGGNDLNMTVYELGERVARLIPGCVVEHRPEMIDPRNYLVDFGKVEHVLGFRPRNGIGDGVEEILRESASAGVSHFDDARYSNAKCLKQRHEGVLAHAAPTTTPDRDLLPVR